MCSVFDTIRVLINKGLTLQEAIQEVETILHTKLPDHIISMIKEENP